MVGFLVLGILVTDHGWHNRALERPVAGWITVTGSVVDVHQVGGRHGSYVYGPVIAFTDRTGVTRRFTAPTSSHDPSYGDPAVVSYNPRNPAQAHDLSDDASSWQTPFVTGVVITSIAGLAIIGSSAWLLVRRRRRRVNPPRPA